MLNSLKNSEFLKSIYYKWKMLRGRGTKGAGHRQIFVDYFKNNFWADSESVSGSGSNLENTAELRNHLRKNLDRLDVKSVLDIPCGDFHWMKQVDLSGLNYTGADIVPELVVKLGDEYGSESVSFVTLDLTESDLPKVDLILCRDCLVHLSFDRIQKALEVVRKSGATYLATTHFPATKKNHDIHTGDWRRLNLCEKPFLWPEPIQSLAEMPTEGGGRYEDKCLAVWRVEDLC